MVPKKESISKGDDKNRSSINKMEDRPIPVGGNSDNTDEYDEPADEDVLENNPAESDDKPEFEIDNWDDASGSPQTDDDIETDEDIAETNQEDVLSDTKNRD